MNFEALVPPKAKKSVTAVSTPPVSHAVLSETTKADPFEAPQNKTQMKSQSSNAERNGVDVSDDDDDISHLFSKENDEQ